MSEIILTKLPASLPAALHDAFTTAHINAPLCRCTKHKCAISIKNLAIGKVSYAPTCISCFKKKSYTVQQYAHDGCSVAQSICQIYDNWFDDDFVPDPVSE
jgi:hypothetical protein